MLFFLYILSIFSYACLGGEGSYIIKIKIYLDEDSFQVISRFMHRLIRFDALESNRLIKRRSSEYYVRLYFGLIFDEINAQFKDSDIQFKADFSDMLKEGYRNLKNKYCIRMYNITNITESFHTEFNNPRLSGRNRILIINCKGNNQFMPKSQHISALNRCGKTHGIILTEPSDLRKIVLEGIYQIFMANSISREFGMNRELIHNACKYIHYCNLNFPDTGYFVKGLKTIGHINDLEEFQRVKNKIWNFGYGLSPAWQVEHEIREERRI